MQSAAPTVAFRKFTIGGVSAALARGAGLLAILAGLALTSSGCVAVTAKGNRFENRWDAVAVDGRVYLIDTRSGEAHVIDVSHATPFEKRCDDPDDISASAE